MYADPRNRIRWKPAKMILKHKLLPGYDDLFGVRTEMEQCYRINPKNQGQKRPILDRFFSKETTNNIMRRAKRYPGKEHLKPTWLSDDLSATDLSKMVSKDKIDRNNKDGDFTEEILERNPRRV